jgi:hypothetical protein
VIVSGGCNLGVDNVVKGLCNKYGLRYVEAPAFWNVASKTGGKAYRPGAGLHRNQTVAMIVDELFAIWDGKSIGTASTIDNCKVLGKKVTIMEL